MPTGTTEEAIFGSPDLSDFYCPAESIAKRLGFPLGDAPHFLQPGLPIPSRPRPSQSSHSNTTLYQSPSTGGGCLECRSMAATLSTPSAGSPSSTTASSSSVCSCFLTNHAAAAPLAVLRTCHNEEKEDAEGDDILHLISSSLNQFNEQLHHSSLPSPPLGTTFMSGAPELSANFSNSEILTWMPQCRQSHPDAPASASQIYSSSSFSSSSLRDQGRPYAGANIFKRSPNSSSVSSTSSSVALVQHLNQQQQPSSPPGLPLLAPSGSIDFSSTSSNISGLVGRDARKHRNPSQPFPRLPQDNAYQFDSRRSTISTEMGIDSGKFQDLTHFNRGLWVIPSSATAATPQIYQKPCAFVSPTENSLPSSLSVPGASNIDFSQLTSTPSVAVPTDANSVAAAAHNLVNSIIWHSPSGWNGSAKNSPPYRQLQDSHPNAFNLGDGQQSLVNRFATAVSLHSQQHQFRPPPAAYNQPTQSPSPIPLPQLLKRRKAESICFSSTSRLGPTAANAFPPNAASIAGIRSTSLAATEQSGSQRLPQCHSKSYGATPQKYTRDLHQQQRLLNSLANKSGAGLLNGAPKPLTGGCSGAVSRNHNGSLCRPRRLSSEASPIAKCRRACSFYLRGHCKKEDCEFAHDLTKVTCKFWEVGECFKGTTCPFLHGYPPELLEEQQQMLQQKPDDDKGTLETIKASGNQPMITA